MCLDNYMDLCFCENLFLCGKDFVMFQCGFGSYPKFQIKWCRMRSSFSKTLGSRPKTYKRRQTIGIQTCPDLSRGCEGIHDLSNGCQHRRHLSWDPYMYQLGHIKVTAKRGRFPWITPDYERGYSMYRMHPYPAKLNTKQSQTVPKQAKTSPH